MLDLMSGGRLELGVGRGVSPFESENDALDLTQTQAMYTTEALAIARRAYVRWRTNSFSLFERHGSPPRVAGLYPKTFDEVAALRTAIAGSPATVRNFFGADVKATGANYWTHGSPLAT